MATLSDNIYTYLSSISDITDVIPADNMSFNDFPQGGAVPYIVFKKLSDPINYYVSNDIRWQRWRFYISHKNKVTLVALAETIITHLNNFRGTLGADSIVSFISCIDNGTPDKLDDLDIYELIQDYRINLH